MLSGHLTQIAIPPADRQNLSSRGMASMRNVVNPALSRFGTASRKVSLWGVGYGTMEKANAAL